MLRESFTCVQSEKVEKSIRYRFNIIMGKCQHRIYLIMWCNIWEDFVFDGRRYVIRPVQGTGAVFSFHIN